MTANNLDLIRKFISGEDTPTVKELYILALQSAAQEFVEAINNPAYFAAKIQPELTNAESSSLAVTRGRMADLLRFDSVVQFRIVELAMREAVIGNDPKITLRVSPEGKLMPPSESEIKTAVASQFANNFLVKELLQKGIIKLSLTWNNG
jgi:hypothetical protein